MLPEVSMQALLVLLAEDWFNLIAERSPISIAAFGSRVDL